MAIVVTGMGVKKYKSFISLTVPISPYSHPRNDEQGLKWQKKQKLYLET